jgi:hypothetical protein
MRIARKVSGSALFTTCGGDEASAPQHDENRRHRARQDSHYHDSFAALSAPSCAMRQGLRGEPGARSHNETTI